MDEEVPIGPNFLVNTIIKPLEKIDLRGNLFNDTRIDFFEKSPKFASFYILSKFHERFKMNRVSH